MKALNSIFKTLTLLLLMGMLFFSCDISDKADYGTLIINLPGSDGARAGVSPQFTATLSYVVNLIGPDKQEPLPAPGGKATIPLSAGEWLVAVDVLNAASETIGKSEEVPVVIEAGKIADLTIPISIDTSGNRITKFAITGVVNSVRSEIEEDGDDYGIIKVLFPSGTFEGVNSGKINGNVIINFTHTGVSASLASGRSMPLADASALFDEGGITITAENGKVRTYYLESEEELPPSLTITGIPSDVEVEDVFVFELNTINTILDLADMNDKILAAGFSENSKDFFLIDAKSLDFGGDDEENFEDNPNLIDFLWKGNGTFDVIIIGSSGYGFSKAKVSFTNGVGSVPWSSFSTIEIDFNTDW